MDNENIKSPETETNSKDKKELIEKIYNCKDKDLLVFLRKYLKSDNWNGNVFLAFLRKILKCNQRNSNIQEHINDIKTLSIEDRLILKARLEGIECTYDRISMINLIGVGLLAFLLTYKDMSKEILFKDKLEVFYVFMLGVYSFIILFLGYHSDKSKKLQSEAKYFLTLIDNIENKF